MYLGARHSVADPGRRGEEGGGVRRSPGIQCTHQTRNVYSILMTECTDPVLATLFSLVTNEKKVSSGIPIFRTTSGKGNTIGSNYWEA